MGETNFPNNSPNLNHNRFKGVKICELITPNAKKIRENIINHIRASPPFMIGYKAKIKKNIKKTIPKLLLELILIFF